MNRSRKALLIAMPLIALGLLTGPSTDVQTSDDDPIVQLTTEQKVQNYIAGSYGYLAD